MKRLKVYLIFSTKHCIRVATEDLLKGYIVDISKMVWDIAWYLVVKSYTKTDKNILFLSSFAWFIHIVSKILSTIVDFRSGVFTF